ncbi:MAG: acetyl-CoA carboxylase biotin carboxyl carrier protein subunit [Candidatus Cloacimonetes bacterium HGW-Cloacimonetes-3]|jgi:biotin carboxyl carrier protein|nr:MAG: acetyl-CoA carboxylase biotin carboxyl carrier protein subunit [Candidatus Cloacimonetes bacterium HGW-Cloacimonetes-3]
MKTYKLTINNEKFDARIVEYSPTHAKININGTDYLVQIEDDKPQSVPKLANQEKAVPMAPSFNSGIEPGSGEVKAPIPGVIVSIPVNEGDTVKKGQTIIILEAMKMQSEIASPFDATIGKIYVKERSPIQEGDLMMTLEGADVKPASVPKPVRQSASVPVENQNASGEKILRAPIPGSIIEVKTSVGSYLEEGDIALILEAMKMESEIHSNVGGRVSKIYVSKGDLVQEGDPLIEFED